MTEKARKKKDTQTGLVLESAILPSLRQGGYRASIQQTVGTRLGGRGHKVDCIAEKDGLEILVSLKWQQVSGTAEQKVPFEVICLIKAIQESGGRFQKAYLVLGGPGWSLRDSYVAEDLAHYIEGSRLVTIVTLESFLARANTGSL